MCVSCGPSAALTALAMIYVNGTAPEAILASAAKPLYGALSFTYNTLLTSAADQLQLLKTLGFESCLAAVSQVFCLTVFRPCAAFQLNNGANSNDGMMCSRHHSYGCCASQSAVQEHLRVCAHTV